MNVNLVSITTPNQSYFRRKLEEIGEDPDKAEELTAEQLMIYIARVSSSRDNKLEDYEGLLNFLIEHGHWSPFQMADMTVEIETSRAIGRQLIRHRSFNFQEFSQRYSSDIDFEPVELREQPDQNRQSSSATLHGEYVNNLTSRVLTEVKHAYKRLISAGVASETARMILPETTQTTLYMKGSVRSWIHYLDLRLKENTQKEHRQVAQAILPYFQSEFPVITNALDLDE
jgi:thymidylate synthase (FAD)